MLKSITYKNVLEFTLPSMAMMIFLSLYIMVDGVFVANLISAHALSAINIVVPMMTLYIAVGTMLGTGGNAICARLLGEGKAHEAKEKFSLFCATGLTIGIALALLTQMFLEDIIYALGANDETFAFCYEYLFIISLFAPVAILQSIFEHALIASGRPGIAFTALVLGGMTNLILDYVLLVYFHMGMYGVALATALGWLVPTVIGLRFFGAGRTELPLHFVKFSIHIRSILSACGNGSSEMVTHLATGVTTFLFNITMLRMAGNDGVAAITVVLYAQIIINALFMGFSMGIAPVFSFYYGAMSRSKLRKLFTICVRFVGGASVVLVLVAFAMNESLAGMFLETSSTAYALTVDGFYIFALGFAFSGMNIFASGLFTAYSNGKVSAFISFFRTFFFIGVSILVLPHFIGLTGVWLAVPVAECLACIMAVFCLRKYRERYMYDNQAHFLRKQTVICKACASK